MRMPISRMRSVTDTSMMFITPMPPTSSEIAAIEPSSTVSVFCVSVAVSSSDAMLRIWKSTLRWRSVEQIVDRRLGFIAARGVGDLHRDRSARSAARTGACGAVVSGTNMLSSMSEP